MTVRYQTQRLDGYTDGKPSWRKQFAPVMRTMSDFETAVEKMRLGRPSDTFRIRKVTTRG